MTARPYHHGDLRRAALAATDEAIRQGGPAALSVRDVARRAGVSHAAFTHHFGARSGLLTALAAEGYETTGLAAWSIVHGFAHLWLSGALPTGPGDDAGDAARPVIGLLSFIDSQAHLS